MAAGVPQPGKPRRGTPEGWRWLEERLRAHLLAGGVATRRGFVRAERAKREPYATSRDVAGYPNGWGGVLAEVQRVLVDVSDLDFDDIGDTTPSDVPTPGSVSAKLVGGAEPPRPAEPRELLELHKAQAELRERKRREQDLLVELRDADLRAEITDALKTAAAPAPVTRRERTQGHREATAVVLASDWHVEEVVDPRTVDGRNAYSPEVATARVSRMTEGVLWLLSMHRERFMIRDLVLWLGGDLISGWIHEELAETNALTPIEAVLLMQELAAGMIRSLLDEGQLERLIIPCSYGNHGRTTRRRRHKNGARSSYEWLAYHHLARQFAGDDRVEFHVSNGSHLYLDVYDQTIRFHHGDDVRYWGGVGGLSIPLNKAVAQWQRFRAADLTCIGHFHQYLHGSDWVVNGSLIGYSEFALSIKATYEPPQQAFFLMDSRRGRCCKTPLWVDEDEKERAAC